MRPFRLLSNGEPQGCGASPRPPGGKCRVHHLTPCSPNKQQSGFFLSFYEAISITQRLFQQSGIVADYCRVRSVQVDEWVKYPSDSTVYFEYPSSWERLRYTSHTVWSMYSVITQRRSAVGVFAELCNRLHGKGKLISGGREVGVIFDRLCLFGVALLVVCGAAVCRADPGNVISWSVSAPSELTFTCQTAVIRMSMLDSNVVRIRQTPAGVPFAPDESYTVIRSWPLAPIGIAVMSDSLTITTSALRVEITRFPFRLTYKRPDGTVLLSDTGTWGLGTGPNAASITFNMPAGEQYYGGGLIEGYPLSFRHQQRSLYNEYKAFADGFTPNLPVPLIVSSKGYGVFVDNTFRQDWNFDDGGGTRWEVVVRGGEMNYYFIDGHGIAGVLDNYTEMTGRAPMPPRWTMGYVQSKYGYGNWGEVYAAKNAFRGKDLPCDALVLDFYWFGESYQMGGLQWDLGDFPDPAANIASLGGDGIKIMNIHEPYLNTQNEPAKSNFDEGASLKYLMADNYPERTIPSTVNGWYGNAGYVDFNNPAARTWWFNKLKHIIDDGVAAHWTDLGEPEADDITDYSYDGKRQEELHNVYSLLWHKALAEGYETHYPDQRLFQFSRAGFAGDQRYGVGHWTSDSAANWQTLEAHLNALGNYGMSGLNLFGTDIGGYMGTPSSELYTRWFQFGAFMPVFRAHGVGKPVAPYEYGTRNEDDCRTMLKLRYRLIPYIYTAARETYETGMPLCRALPLAFPGDPLVQENGTQYMFGPSIMVAPITGEGITSRSVYLPDGRWIDHWSGKALTGPVTTNWPAPLSQIPLFYADNTIIPLGPYVASSQFDDGSQRGLRVNCSSEASYVLYDDDGASNEYKTNNYATTSIAASNTASAIHLEIAGTVGTYSGQPGQRAWYIEVYCTNEVASVEADGGPLPARANATEIDTAGSGYYFDMSAKLLRIKLPPASITQSRSVTVNLGFPLDTPYEVRVNCGGNQYVDQYGQLWAADNVYASGSFGYNGGGANTVYNPIDDTDSDLLYQNERNGTGFDYRFDCPAGQYEIELLNADTYWTTASQRLFNVSINGKLVLTNFDIVAEAGGINKPTSTLITNLVSGGHLHLAFAGVTTPYDINARISAIRVRKVSELSSHDSVGDGIPDWWRAYYFGGDGTTTNDASCAECDPDGDGSTNLQEFDEGTYPLIASAIRRIGSVTNVTYTVDATNGNTTAYYWISNGGVVQVSPFAADTVRVRFYWTSLWDKEEVAIAKPFGQWDAVNVTITDSPGTNIIETENLIIEVVKKPNFKINFLDRHTGYVLSADERIEYDSGYNPMNDSSYNTVACCGTWPEGFKLKVRRDSPGDEAYFGLGENTGAPNRRGQAIQHWNADNYAWNEGQNPLYMSMPFFYGVRPAGEGRPEIAYGIFFDNPNRPFFKMNIDDPNEYSFEAADGQIDYYFFGGGSNHTMRSVLDRYSELTGRPAKLPKWAYGYHQSRWSYDTQGWIEWLSGEFANQDIPLDVIHVDIDYMDTNHDNNYSDGTAHQLTFNSNFPNPAGMIANCGANGVRLVPILEPWITTQDPKWSEANSQQHFVKNNDGFTHVSQIGFFSDLSWIEFSKTESRNWWKGKVLNFLDQYPFAGFWNDLNEPADHQKIPLNALFWLDGRYGFNPGDSRQWYLSEKNPFCVRETSLTYEILQEKYPDKRPFVLSRAGWPGIGRYALGWSGDSRATWDAIRYTIPLTVSTMISGQPNFGGDIGGFVGSPSPELLTRWHEYAVLNPFCRNHSQKGDVEREPWRFGEPYTSLMRNSIKFRYRLMPYLYTLAHESTVDGMPMNAPTVFHFTGDANTYSMNNNDFMIGDWLLAAPVWVSGASDRTAYLPAGTDWYYWPTGDKYVGGQEHTVPAPLGTLPLFVRAGAIIPMGPPMQHVDEFTPDYLDINCWPAGESSFSLYEDEGDGWGYQTGMYARTTFESSRTSGNWTFTVGAREGSFDPGARTFFVYVYNPEAVESVMLDGVPLAELNDLGDPAPGWLMTGDGKLAIKFADTGAEQSIVVDWNQNLDSVGDGIPDWWRAFYFGGDGTTTNAQSCATCDSDMDGLTTREEWIAGTDPTSAFSTFRIDEVRGDEASSAWIEWFARTGRIYGVYYMDSLMNGATAFPLGSWTNIEVVSDGMTNVVDETSDATNRYYMIKVRMAP